ncbi:DUF2207 domain-containing protein [Nesterenkonia ebinurensis]|uniref:DUF2207 domain-containing protein n=1 Tax=Nesterenkonia ebinurensis TaxID=2608252 RepID=UPI00123CC8F8|nr:DUF2207 domain-containing protein [Nesterenkonia ebinurensis]
MADLEKLNKIGWLLVGAAVLTGLLVIIGLFNGLGFWGAFWSFLFIVLPLAVIGLALLGKRWFKLSKRTGRRL